MIQPGDIIKIKAPDGSKTRGRVTHVTVETEPIGDPQHARPGRTHTSIEVVIEQ